MSSCVSSCALEMSSYYLPENKRGGHCVEASVQGPRDSEWWTLLPVPRSPISMLGFGVYFVISV